VDTFVIISGDSDFSPLVAKLRENAKYVVGVGVKQSTSDLLIANCDEFIFYDDLVREVQRAARRDARGNQPVVRRTPEEEAQRRAELEDRRSKAIELAVATFDALIAERGDSGKIWASMLKEAVKRRKPDFAESYYGFRAFGNLLEEAQARGLLELGRDEKSGTYVMRCNGIPGRGEPTPVEVVDETVEEAGPSTSPLPESESGNERASGVETDEAILRSKGRSRRKVGEKSGKPPREGKGERRNRLPADQIPATPDLVESTSEPATEIPPAEIRPTETASSPLVADPDRTAEESPVPSAPPVSSPTVDNPEPDATAARPTESLPLAEEDAPADKALRKAPTRSRRPRKPKPEPEAAG
ncbi:MAG TPA: NYN domain-containing protein, partial [Accumulibacter sp.]|nr:NYN domain-containing protein [Accumulibacter sp.]